VERSNPQWHKPGVEPRTAGPICEEILVKPKKLVDTKPTACYVADIETGVRQMARMTRTDAKLQEILNSKGAPDFSTLDYTAPDFNTRYGLALNWVHQAVEQDELVREAQSYFARMGRVDAANLVKLVPFGIQQTMGKIAYCLNRGAELSPKSHTYLENGLLQAKTVSSAVVETMEDMQPTAAGRLTEHYVACYSRIDNLKTRVLRGKVELRDVPREVQTILENNGGARVIKRLVQHYQESLAEAQEDKLIRDWVKPLRAILKALGGDEGRVKAAPKQVAKAPESAATKAEAQPVQQPVKQAKKAKSTKGKGKKVKQVQKAVRAKAPKAPSAAREAGKPSFVQQVRALIAQHKPQGRTVREVTAMAEALGMKSSSARNAVVGCWDRV